MCLQDPPGSGRTTNTKVDNCATNYPCTRCVNGDCITTCEKCQKCVGGKCIQDCPICEECNEEGNCGETKCPVPCEKCTPGYAGPKGCMNSCIKNSSGGICEICDPDTKTCVNKCLSCETCIWDVATDAPKCINDCGNCSTCKGTSQAAGCVTDCVTSACQECVLNSITKKLECQDRCDANICEQCNNNGGCYNVCAPLCRQCSPFSSYRASSCSIDLITECDQECEKGQLGSPGKIVKRCKSTDCYCDLQDPYGACHKCGECEKCENKKCVTVDSNGNKVVGCP